MAYKVYISSSYSEFSEIRKQIKQYINGRSELYEFIGMEDYGSEDKKPLDKCVEDVAGCDFYVCILGYRYGSIAPKNERYQNELSFTHWEYYAAKDKKNIDPDYQRWVFVKNTPGAVEDDDRLKELKKENLGERLAKNFTEDKDLPELILKNLDRHIANLRKKEVSNDLLYSCDRNKANLIFTGKLNRKLVHFFMIHSHDSDIPYYFIQRKKKDFEENLKSVVLVDLQTNNLIEEEEDFESLDFLMRAAILEKLPSDTRIQGVDDITIPKLSDLLCRMNKDFLIITWNIQSIYWKNDLFCSHIKKFYEKYNADNADSELGKKIIFVGIAKYIDNSKITEAQFDERIKQITYGTSLPKFTKINKREVKEWLDKTSLEKNPIKADGMIQKTLGSKNKEEFFFAELEDALKLMIEEYNKQN